MDLDQQAKYWLILALLHSFQCNQKQQLCWETLPDLQVSGLQDRPSISPQGRRVCRLFLCRYASLKFVLLHL